MVELGIVDEEINPYMSEAMNDMILPLYIVHRFQMTHEHPWIFAR